MYICDDVHVPYSCSFGAVATERGFTHLQQEMIPRDISKFVNFLETKVHF